ncbi:MAG TPA: hypothetical protein VKA46_09015, partial [Gemmataceae bacterium]|nr:hypothetical protein [Gemmataceae bacterium]
PDAGNPPVRFDEREVETGHGVILGHRQPKGPATRKAPLNYRATSRLYIRPLWVAALMLRRYTSTVNTPAAPGVTLVLGLVVGQSSIDGFLQTQVAVAQCITVSTTRQSKIDDPLAGDRLHLSGKPAGVEQVIAQKVSRKYNHA